MALISKGSIRIIDGKAYVHPLTLKDIEFLLELLAQTQFQGMDVQKVFVIAHKLQKEYTSIKKLSQK
tara:strand:- start:41 stop:241 length:201 start_codon:yes stop_codon:yes gene_type:complete